MWGLEREPCKRMRQSRLLDKVRLTGYLFSEQKSQHYEFQASAISLSNLNVIKISQVWVHTVTSIISECKELKFLKTKIVVNLVKKDGENGCCYRKDCVRLVRKIIETTMYHKRQSLVLLCGNSCVGYDDSEKWARQPIYKEQVRQNRAKIS